MIQPLKLNFPGLKPQTALMGGLLAIEGGCRSGRPPYAQSRNVDGRGRSGEKNINSTPTNEKRRWRIKSSRVCLDMIDYEEKAPAEYDERRVPLSRYELS